MEKLDLKEAIYPHPLIKGAKLQPKQKVNLQQATLKAASCQGLEGAFSGASWSAGRSNSLSAAKQLATARRSRCAKIVLFAAHLTRTNGANVFLGLKSLWPLGVRPTYLEAAWKHVDMNMLSTLGPNKRAHEHPNS